MYKNLNVYTNIFKYSLYKSKTKFREVYVSGFKVIQIVRISIMLVII